jgi:N-acetylneuraminic acid mutarotase
MPHLPHVTVAVSLFALLSACSTDPSAPNAGAPTAAAATVVNSWTTGTSLSPWRMAMAAGSVGGKIYVVGGRSRSSTALSRVDVYDIATEGWSSARRLPARRSNPNGASMINGKLYVSGGRDPSGNPTRTLFVYDPSTDRWTRKADVPQPSCGGAQGAINGRLYVYTGCYAKDFAGVFFRYDPSMDRWVKRPAPPVDHAGGAGGVVSGRFHLVAGFAPACSGTCDALGRTHHAYDPGTNSWTTRAPISSIRSSMAAAGLNGRLYVAGGSAEFELAAFESYDPVADRWTTKASLPRATTAGAAAVSRGKVYFVSGTDMLSAVAGPSRLYVYTP